MTLLELKQSYQAQNTQFFTIDSKGDVIESDNNLFNIEAQAVISKIHPFFDGLPELLSESATLNFSCVHLKINNIELVCDIDIEKITPILYSIIITDFSKHYRSFQSLVQSRNETAIKSESLVIKNELLEEKEAFKNKFIENFSHEVKNPITSIVSFYSLLKDTKLTTQQKEYLNVIKSSSFHLKSIINDILDISKIETGKLEIMSKRLNFSTLIAQITSQYTLACHKKSLKFDVTIDKNIPTYIISDETRILQLMQNILDNAIKFTSKGSVSLEVKNIYHRAQNMILSIIVKDTGIGIPEKDRDYIFKRFNRLESSKNIEGVGLGLTVVNEIVKLMNGDLTFESEPNKGSTFTLNIKVNSTIIQPKLKKENKQVSFKQGFNNKTKRKQNILLVEDNTNHQLSIFKILASTKRYYLDIVSNGLDAIKAINKSNYDLVLMDFVMPTLNGLETSKAIKNFSDKQKKDIPIILITGSLIDSELLNKKGIYFYDIIEKPFEKETLINTIQSCIK